VVVSALRVGRDRAQGSLGKELVGQDAVPPEYHGLWGKNGNCCELEQPFFMSAVFVTKKAIAFDKQSYPINATLEDGDAFKAAFNSVTVGEDKLQTLPARLALRDASFMWQLVTNVRIGLTSTAMRLVRC